MEKPMRNRIPFKPAVLSPILVDELAFVENKCSSKARKVSTIKEIINLHIWFDKHYEDRHQFGENNGVKRDGIDPDTVNDLIVRSIKHLFFYSSTVGSFKFINLSSTDTTRVHLRDIEYETPLNVVIEVHYLQVNEFEITVKTAMCVNDFRTQQGQFTVELEGDNSFLFKNNNKILTKVGEY